MNLSSAVIDGVLKLIAKIPYKNKETVVRVYSTQDSRIPESILFESKTKPGVYLDEVNDKMYHEINGRWIGI